MLIPSNDNEMKLIETRFACIRRSSVFHEPFKKYEAHSLSNPLLN